MALSTRATPVFYQDLRRRILSAADQLEQWRAVVERQPPARRRNAELALDELRGRLNRAQARLEAARMAGDDAWRVSAARADAQACADELFDELARLESRLPLAA